MVTNAPLLAAGPSVAIRGSRERVIQTVWFEALGLLIISPLFAHFTSAQSGQALLVLLSLACAAACWSALYNTAFDRIEYRTCRRVASDRPHALRVLHSVGHEVSTTILTWPLLVVLTSLSWLDALVVDIGLTLTYAIYGYIFHWGFDRLRPVRPAAVD